MAAECLVSRSWQVFERCGVDGREIAPSAEEWCEEEGRSRHAELNRGPAVYELERPERCGTSVESRASLLSWQVFVSRPVESLRVLLRGGMAPRCPSLDRAGAARGADVRAVTDSLIR
jgi:hypothetical protein